MLLNNGLPGFVKFGILDTNKVEQNRISMIRAAVFIIAFYNGAYCKITAIALFYGPVYWPFRSMKKRSWKAMLRIF